MKDLDRVCFQPASFHLLKSRNLNGEFNAQSPSIRDLFQGEFTWAFLSNYMFDLDWLTSECPWLLKASPVVVFYDQRGIEREEVAKYSSQNFIFHRPPLPHPFGTHHSKFLILGFPHKVRIAILTANFLRSDFEDKTQAVWVQEFPLKSCFAESPIQKPSRCVSLTKSNPLSQSAGGVLGNGNIEGKNLKIEEKRSENDLDVKDETFKTASSMHQTSPFEEDLLQYLNCLGWKGCNLNDSRTGKRKRNQEELNTKDGENYKIERNSETRRKHIIGSNDAMDDKTEKGDDFILNFSILKRFDYSFSAVRLIGSIPGYHKQDNLIKFGHMKLRNILENSQNFDPIFTKSPLIYQVSSIGSLDEKWMQEFRESTSAGKSFNGNVLGFPEKVSLVWPTVEQVRKSHEGYSAGASLCSPSNNLRKSFLNDLFTTWDAEVSGRCRIMPHIKSYTRFRDQNLAWVLLTSANLSKAAWGTLQKNKSQLFIRSYELGVVFLPCTVQKCLDQLNFCQIHESSKGKSDFTHQYDAYSKNETERHTPQTTKTIFETSQVRLVAQITKQNIWFDLKELNCTIHFPIPYSLPPHNYCLSDRPWIWDQEYSEKDAYGVSSCF